MTTADLQQTDIDDLVRFMILQDISEQIYRDLLVRIFMDLDERCDRSLVSTLCDTLKNLGHSSTDTQVIEICTRSLANVHPAWGDVLKVTPSLAIDCDKLSVLLNEVEK
jgi:hypothetical protein